MNVVMTISTEDTLSKEQVFSIARIINKICKDTVIGGKGKKVADLNKSNGINSYTFEYDTNSTEEVCDQIANEIYNTVDVDFEMEIDCDMNEDYLDTPDNNKDNDLQSKSELLIEDEPSVKHSKWMSSKIKDGWVFGSEYNEDDKTDPLMRPYHSLSGRQQALALSKH